MAEVEFEEQVDVGVVASVSRVRPRHVAVQRLTEVDAPEGPR